MHTANDWCADWGGTSLKVIPVFGGLYTYPCGWAAAVNAKHETTINVFILRTIQYTLQTDQLQVINDCTSSNNNNYTNKCKIK